MADSSARPNTMQPYIRAISTVAINMPPKPPWAKAKVPAGKVARDHIRHPQPGQQNPPCRALLKLALL
jgi:hypothetical protein